MKASTSIFAVGFGGLMLDYVISCGEAPGNDVVYETVRYGHYVEFNCCCCSGHPIVWSKWNVVGNQWQHYVPDRPGIKLLNNNRVLSVQSSMFEDKGLYRCGTKNDTSFQVNTFNLNVVACDKLARGPYSILPLPCTETETFEGDLLTLPCTGYFGCEDDGDIRIVKWFVSINKNGHQQLVDTDEADRRYKQQYYAMEDNTVKGSNLTIDGVSSVDFERKFICLLASPQMVKGQTKLTFSLKKATTCKDGLGVKNASFDYLIMLFTLAIVLTISMIVNVALIIKCKRRRKQENRHNKRKCVVRVCFGC